MKNKNILDSYLEDIQNQDESIFPMDSIEPIPNSSDEKKKKSKNIIYGTVYPPSCCEIEESCK